MFGRKAIERARTSLVRTLKAKSVQIMVAHSTKTPEEIPWLDVARATMLMDLADIIQNLGVEEVPDDK